MVMFYTLIVALLILLDGQFLDSFRIVEMGLLFLVVVILFAFLFDIGIKLYGYGNLFFKSKWNIFDTAIISLCLVAAIVAGVVNRFDNFSPIRCRGIFRVLSLVVVFRQLVDI